MHFQEQELKAYAIAYDYQDTSIFSDLSFELKSGEVMQVLGGNGKGKSTLLKVLAGLLQPLKGEIFWNQRSIAKYPEDYRMQVFYMGHKLGLKSHLTAEENLMLMASLKGMKTQKEEILEAIDKVGLVSKKDRFVYQLSAGQQQRLVLSQLFLNPGGLWILDEPFNALCYEGQSIMKDLIWQNCCFGTQVIFTAHHAIDLNLPVRKIEL
jgi:heme exporter protein A